MNLEKSSRHTRIREALNRLYDHEPPQFREYLRRFREEPTSRVFAPLAEAYRRMGKVDEAMAICEEGLRHHPDFPGGRVAFAKCLLDKREYPSALAELERVVQVAPENLLAQRLMADTHLLLGDRTNALHRYRLALLLSPSDVALVDKVHRLEQSVDAVSAEEAPPSCFLSDPVEDSVSMPLTESAPPPVPSKAEDESPLPAMWLPIPEDSEENDQQEDLHRRQQVDAILGVTQADTEEDGYRVGAVQEILPEPENAQEEITTETLGDLYFAQEQFEKSLKIFERLYEVQGSSPELLHKIQKCRRKLGVDDEQLAKKRKIEKLEIVLQRVRSRSTVAGND